MTDPSQPSATTPQARPTNNMAPLLLIAAVIVGGIIYGVWQNRGVTELRDAIAGQQTTIQSVNASLDKLRTENSATLDKLRAENSESLDKLRAENSAGLAALRAENADLKSRLAAAEARVTTSEAAFAKSQQRDPDAIYQAGVEVGRVTGASEDRAASTVTFETIEGGTFDRAKEFDYRNLTLVVKSQKGAMTSFTGRGVQTQLTGVEATIVKTRAAP